MAAASSASSKASAAQPGLGEASAAQPGPGKASAEQPEAEKHFPLSEPVSYTHLTLPTIYSV